MEDLKVPDDMPIPESLKGDVQKFITDNKLGPEQAQAVIDMGVKIQQESLDFWTKTKSEWRTETEADPTFGGKNLAASLAEANRIVRTFGDDQLKEDIMMLGLGNKLSFMRFLNKIAGATKEDNIAGAGAAGGDGKVPVSKIFYPNMA